MLNGELIRCWMDSVVNSSGTNLPVGIELSLHLISYLISQFLWMSSDAIRCVQEQLSHHIEQGSVPLPQVPQADSNRLSIVALAMG
jgi:hypothetical protein